MEYHTRKWIKPEDLNPNHTLFGGRLLQWIDEEAALYAISILETPRCVTKYISEINFISSAKQGDIIDIGIEVIRYGKTSITLQSDVTNSMTKQTIVTIDEIVFVGVDENGKPTEHGKSK